MARKLNKFEIEKRTNELLHELVDSIHKVLKAYRNLPSWRFLATKYDKQAFEDARNAFYSKKYEVEDWLYATELDKKAKLNLEGMLGFSDTISGIIS